MLRVHRQLLYIAGTIFSAVLLLNACGGGGGGGGNGGDGNTKTGDDVKDTLTNLKVNTNSTPRLDSKAEPMPESFAPLGKSKTLEKKSEIFLAGLITTQSTDHVNVLKFLPGVSNVPGVPPTADNTTILNTASLDTTWKNDIANDAVVGDVDGDGLDEIVLLWWDSENSNAVKLKVIDDATEGFAESTTSVLTTANVSWLRVATGDFNGDAIDDIMIAIVEDSAGKISLEFLSGSKTGGYSIDGTKTKTFSAAQSPSTLDIQLAVGQLDLDGGEEFAVVINETWGRGRNASPGFGTSYYYIYDDAGANFNVLKTARVSGEVGTATYNGVKGTLAIGDVDGDGMDEIVLAALADDFPVLCESLAVIQFVLDDAFNTFTNLGVNYNTDQRPNGCETGGNNGHTEHIWAGVLDIDGDQYAEIHVNGLVYEDFANASSPWDPLLVDTNTGTLRPARIPFEYLFKDGSGGNARAQVRREDNVMVVGDVTADGKDDIIVYSQGQVDIGDQTNGNITYDITEWAITVWGIDPVTGRWGKENITGREGNIGMLYFEELAVPAQGSPSGGPPLIVVANVDKDSTMLKFSEGSHQVVFSEPLVHAALAAPPCYDDGTQVSDDCRTSWGTGNTTGIDASISHEISVKFHSGVSGDVSIPLIGKVGVEVESTAGVSLKKQASFGYQLTKTVTYTTGPMEDTVVATVIPYDQYTYKILSHPVFPELVGKDMVVSLPRSPRTMQLSRQFYNDSLVGDGLRIDSRVFDHTIGEPSTYPTRSEMLANSDALSIGPKDIGASLGNQSVSISESKVAGLTKSVAVSFETTVKATGGKVMRGFTVGSTAEASLGFSVGTEVTFTGTVGDMPPATFDLEKAYSFGMFVYKQDPGNQRPFQVINYWVE